MGYEDEAWLERVTTEQPRHIDTLVRTRAAAYQRALTPREKVPRFDWLVVAISWGITAGLAMILLIQ